MQLCMRWTALCLSLLFLLFSSLPLYGCGVTEDSDTPPVSNDDQGGNNKNPGSAIITPPYKDYPDRRTTKYENMTYSRPDFDAVIALFSDAISLIEKNEVTYDEQLHAIENLGDPYENVLTMYSVIEIKNMNNLKDKSIAEEHSYVLTNYPRFAGKIEDLYVACARSPYAREFEKDYFEEDISSYADGGKLTDEVVELLAKEGKLESDYSTLSSSETFEFKGEVNTYDYFLNKLYEKYASIPDSAQFYSEKAMLDMAYEEQISEPITNLYVELVRVRCEIADALGDENYLAFAYEENGFEYTTREMKNLLCNIKNYVAPVYWDSSFYSAYSLKMQSVDHTRPFREEMINQLYNTYQLTDRELGDIYAFMLQYELYDIERGSSERFEGAFTTYLPAYDAPFLFATLGQTNGDYLTLAHEFGHFADFFVNGSSGASLDLEEVYSQGLELLTTISTKRILPQDVTVYLKYQALYSVVQTLMVQGYYSDVELRIYSLDYEDITKENITAITKEVAEEYGFGNPESFDISAIIITHTVLYPTYVQSYCTSALSALELYMMETTEEGAGFEAYKNLLHRDASHSYIEALEAAGLQSPFKKDLVKTLVDGVYYEFLGRHYFGQSSDVNVA